MKKQDEDLYFTVTLKAMSFATEKEAKDYMGALVDAFIAMPESENIACMTTINKVT
jgi:hypothetical protein